MPVLHRGSRAAVFLLGLLSVAYALNGQALYDLLLKGGHVIDGKNHVSALRDVAIAGGKIAAVAPNLDRKLALKTANVSGLYVTPGLVDIYEHVYAYTDPRGSSADDRGPIPDALAFRSGVTTLVDPGDSGWRTFEDFRARIIDHSRTRVLAMLNIVGWGTRGGKYDQDMDDMDVRSAAEMAVKYKNAIVAITTADFAGPEWKPFEQAVEAGRIANIPVVIDYGTDRTERPLYDLLTRVLRPGDIFSHMYSGRYGEQEASGGPSKAMVEGRKRGVMFDVGPGTVSFSWSLAVPMVKAGFIPDSISSDLHITSKDLQGRDILSIDFQGKDFLTVMSKFLALGMPLDSVILRATWNPAKEIKREEIGNLSVGSPADVAVLRLENGKFSFLDKDRSGAKLDGSRKLVCALTIRDGEVVYDLNGITR